MKHTMRRNVFGAAVLACTAAVGIAFGAGNGYAAPPPSAEQQFADYLAAGPRSLDGRQIRPIVDTGSAGPRPSWASNTLRGGPEMSSYLAAFAYSLTHPDAAPSGANDWGCTPGAAHPDPIVLVHGTWLDAYDSFAAMSPALAGAGFCVFAFNYGRSGLLDGGGIGSVMPGRYGIGPIEDSARQLGDFVDRVRAATHAERVDIVAHSQGAPVTDQYLKFDGGAGKIGKIISLGGTHHGTTLLGMATLGRLLDRLGVPVFGFYQPIIGPANVQQAVGSDFLTRLSAGGDTVPGVAYTVVESRYDEVMNPVALGYLHAGRGATVHDITLQDGCEQDMSDHLTMMYSPRALSIVLHALDPAAHPGLVCTFNPWLVGGGGGL